MTLPTRRIIVLRANRDTLVLIACTVGVTLALASVHRQHGEPPAREPPAQASSRQVWAGQLSEVPSVNADTIKPEPITSASLVVPKNTFALPPAQPANRGAARSNCDTGSCAARTAALPVPPVPSARQRPATNEAGGPAKPSIHLAGASDRKREQRFQLSDLNPLHHLPDAVRKPFSYAGAKVSSWIDWF